MKRSLINGKMYWQPYIHGPKEVTGEKEQEAKEM